MEIFVLAEFEGVWSEFVFLLIIWWRWWLFLGCVSIGALESGFFWQVIFKQSPQLVQAALILTSISVYFIYF